jgi:hypothetical protein
MFTIRFWLGRHNRRRSTLDIWDATAIPQAVGNVGIGAALQHGRHYRGTGTVSRGRARGSSGNRGRLGGRTDLGRRPGLLLHHLVQRVRLGGGR